MKGFERSKGYEKAQQEVQGNKNKIAIEKQINCNREQIRRINKNNG